MDFSARAVVYICVVFLGENISEGDFGGVHGGLIWGGGVLAECGFTGFQVQVIKLFGVFFRHICFFLSIVYYAKYYFFSFAFFCSFFYLVTTHTFCLCAILTHQ